MHPEEEGDALGVYREREPVIKDFPIKHTVAPNPNGLIFRHVKAKKYLAKL